LNGLLTIEGFRLKKLVYFGKQKPKKAKLDGIMPQIGNRQWNVNLQFFSFVPADSG